MFDAIQRSLKDALKKLSGRGRISEANIRDGLSEVRTALLEADVNVNPRYGSWSAELTSVVPPEGPQPPPVEEEAPRETVPEG